MHNEPGKGSWASPKALARYDAVRFVEEAVQSGLPLRRALEAAHERQWGSRCYGAPTIEDWYYQYRHQGLAGLEDIPRKDKGHVRALAPETLDAFLALRRAQPQVYATTLLRQLESQGVLAPRSVSISISTFYRALAREGLDRRSVRAGSAMLKGPTKAFEFSWANQLWMMPRLHMGVNRPLLSRMGYCLCLEPWTREQAAEYVQQRLLEVGLHENVFVPEAQELLLRIAGGIPRTINHLGQRAFEEAARDHSRAISREHIQKALDQLPWLGRLREEQ